MAQIQSSSMNQQLMQLYQQAFGLSSGLGMAGQAINAWGDPDELKRQQEKAKECAAELKSKIIKLNDVPAMKIAARIPDYMGTLTAWRGWKVTDGKLTALGMSGVWEPKKAIAAKCSRLQHPAPSKDCTCGYWTFKSMELLKTALDPYAMDVKVIGTVEHWGKVIECENGFRSEFAYPKELWLLDEDLEHLSWTYGVPVRKL